MKPVGRLIRCPWGASALWLDREHDLRAGETLAASYMNIDEPPLRTGRLVVSAVHRDGRCEVTQPAHDAIPALVAHPEGGDWLYRVQPEAGKHPARDIVEAAVKWSEARDEWQLRQTFSTRCALDEAGDALQAAIKGEPAPPKGERCAAIVTALAGGEPQ